MKIGIIGSGSWATALAKIVTDNNISINWWVRNDDIVKHMMQRHHNPNYLRSVYFNTSLISLSTDVSKVVAESDCVVIAVPSAYVVNTLEPLAGSCFADKKIVSAVKGILPDSNQLLNDYLKDQYGVQLNDYFTVMGPCHAEEVAAEK